MAPTEKKQQTAKTDFLRFLFITILKRFVTYLRAQMIYKKRHGKTVKTCWIADVKRKHGKTTHQAHNRSSSKPKYPCPADVYPNLEKILLELGMI